MADNDPILPFSRDYKGKPLSQVPVDYMKWAIEDARKKGADFVFKGVNWTRLFRDEIDRRENRPSSVDPALNALFEAGNAKAGVQSPPSTIDSNGIMITDCLDDPVEDLVGLSTPQVLEPSKEVPQNVALELKLQAVNFASLHFLREFILRKDKNQSLGDWVIELAEEALRYGNGTTKPKGDCLFSVSAYAGYLYYLRTEVKTGHRLLYLIAKDESQ